MVLKPPVYHKHRSLSGAYVVDPRNGFGDTLIGPFMCGWEMYEVDWSLQARHSRGHYYGDLVSFYSKFERIEDFSVVSIPMAYVSDHTIIKKMTLKMSHDADAIMKYFYPEICGQDWNQDRSDECSDFSDFIMSSPDDDYFYILRVRWP